jgi:predicted amidophosphoribosyltransferase
MKRDLLCEHCGGRLAEGTDSCPHCGLPLSADGLDGLLEKPFAEMQKMVLHRYGERLEEAARKLTILAAELDVFLEDR